MHGHWTKSNINKPINFAFVVVFIKRKPHIRTQNRDIFISKGRIIQYNLCIRIERLSYSDEEKMKKIATMNEIQWYFHVNESIVIFSCYFLLCVIVFHFSKAYCNRNCNTSHKRMYIYTNLQIHSCKNWYMHIIASSSSYLCVSYVISKRLFFIVSDRMQQPFHCLMFPFFHSI